MIFGGPAYLLFTLPALLLAIYAQFKVKSAYAKYSGVPVSRGITGAQAAQALLHNAGIEGVGIEMTQGYLSDHYDPKSKTLRLSPDVYNGRSVASVGIAAHEAGHALQHAVGYTALGLRSALVPVASIGSWISIPMIVLGMAIHAAGFVMLGLILFTAIVGFQLVTLPVEFDASNRAKKLLSAYGIVSPSEAEGVNRVLSAAALTYVAATITAVLELVYWLWRAGLIGRSREE